MISQTVYLITGANRGIGFGLTEVLAKRPETVVFAGVRDPASATALKDLSKKYPNVHILKLTSGSVEDNQDAAKEIERISGQLDIVIANAGIANHQGPAATTPISQFTDHFNVNTLGPVVLFQAVKDLLLKSPSGAPQFTVISSALGSIGLMFPFGSSAYGMSKAAANFWIKLLHVEHAAEGIVTMAIHPGWVATDMGNSGATAMGMKEAPVDISQSVAGVLSHVDNATRAEKSGKFWNFAKSSGNVWDIDTPEVPW